MAKLSFLLKEPKASAATPLFAFFSFNGQRVKIYSGLSVHPKQWMKAEQRAQTRGYPASGPLNDALDLLSERLLAIYAEHRAKGSLPSVEELRAAALPEAQIPSESAARHALIPKSSFASLFQNWTDSQKGVASPNTLRTNNTALKHVLAFQRYAGYDVDFDTITVTFGDRFTSYLLQQAHLTDNTINKVLTRLKRFLRYAVERGYTENRAFERIKWKSQEPEIITLTEVEVQQLQHLDLTDSPYLRNARDLFLLSCYTGLRYSDLVSIRQEHLRKGSLRITTQKTRDTVTIPLRPAASELVERYFAGEIRAISNQKLNTYLKELGRLADLNTPVEVIRFRGGQRLSQTFAKWECLGCHTGRRTFVTLALEKGLRPELVMKVTGHRSWQSFKRYVNITEKTVENEFARVFG